LIYYILGTIILGCDIMDYLQNQELEEKDRTLGALCYGSILLNLVTGFVGLAGPFYILLSEHKEKPLLKFHAIQAIVTQLMFLVGTSLAVILAGIIGVFTSGCGGLLTYPLAGLFSLFLLAANLYWAYKVYKGENFSIPYITDIILKQFNK
jgi:uncharacterized membrane protein